MEVGEVETFGKTSLLLLTLCNTQCNRVGALENLIICCLMDKRLVNDYFYLLPP